MTGWLKAKKANEKKIIRSDEEIEKYANNNHKELVSVTNYKSQQLQIEKLEKYDVKQFISKIDK